MRSRQDVSRYYVDAFGPDDEAVKIGFGWLIEYSRDHAYSEATIWGYDLQSIRNLTALGKERAASLLRNREILVAGVTVKAVTRRSGRHGLGPVLAVWVDDQDLLDEIDQWRVPAVCAIPWTDIDDWRGRWDPTNLRSKASPVAASTPTRHVVTTGLEAVTRRANLSNGLDTYNRSAAGQAFKALVEAGEDLNSAEIRHWAAQNGWGAENAKELASLAERIRDGARVQLGHTQMWKEDIVEYWRGLTNDGETEDQGS